MSRVSGVSEQTERATEWPVKNLIRNAERVSGVSSASEQTERATEWPVKNLTRNASSMYARVSM